MPEYRRPLVTSECPNFFSDVKGQLKYGTFSLRIPWQHSTKDKQFKIHGNAKKSTGQILMPNTPHFRHFMSQIRSCSTVVQGRLSPIRVDYYPSSYCVYVYQTVTFDFAYWNLMEHPAACSRHWADILQLVAIFCTVQWSD